MKLTQLAAKPQLIKLQLDDEQVMADYGEPIEFWIYDRQPIDKFVRMATVKPEDFGQLVEAINDMILDEEGNKIIKDGESLPTAIMTKVINKVVDTLGK